MTLDDVVSCFVDDIEDKNMPRLDVLIRGMDNDIFFIFACIWVNDVYNGMVKDVNKIPGQDWAKKYSEFVRDLVKGMSR